MGENNARFEKFLLWELAARDTIDFKKIYVDMCEDLNGGLMLSEIVYWYLPNRETGESKLRVEHDGFMWIACRRYEWWDRTRLTPDKADSALKHLEKAGLIIRKVYKFGGSPTVHVRLNEAAFMDRWAHTLNNPPLNPFLSEMEIGKKTKTKSDKNGKGNQENPEKEFGENGKTLTEITPETPAWITAFDGRASALPAYITAMIYAWAKSWPGSPAGNAYGVKFNRAEAEKMLKRGLTPYDVERFCNALAVSKQYKTRRATYSTVANDIDSWLLANPDANTPAPAEPEPETNEGGESVSEIEARIEARRNLNGGQ